MTYKFITINKSDNPSPVKPGDRIALRFFSDEPNIIGQDVHFVIQSSDKDACVQKVIDHPTKPGWGYAACYYNVNAEDSGLFYAWVKDTNENYVTTDGVNLVVKEPEAETVVVNVHVSDQFSEPVICDVNIPGALGAKTIRTNYDGVAVGFTLEKDKTYTATVIPPSGYTSTSDSAVRFTASTSGGIYCSLNKSSSTSPGSTTPPTPSTSTFKNIPKEIVDVMPEGTVRIVAIPLKPLPWANLDGLKSKISSIVEIVANVISVGGYTGWRCLGADVVNISNKELQLVIFLGGA